MPVRRPRVPAARLPGSAVRHVPVEIPSSWTLEMDVDPAQRTRSQHSMPTAAHAAVLQMRSLPGSPPNGVDYVDGCVPDEHASRGTTTGAARSRVAQRIHATRVSARTGETGNA